MKPRVADTDDLGSTEAPLPDLDGEGVGLSPDLDDSTRLLPDGDQLAAPSDAGGPGAVLTCTPRVASPWRRPRRVAHLRGRQSRHRLLSAVIGRAAPGRWSIGG